MKMKISTRCFVLIFAILASIIVCNFYSIDASADNGDGVLNDCIDQIDTAHDPCKRAKIKAMVKTLAHCTAETESSDIAHQGELLVMWALQGKWGGEDDEGDTDTGYNIYDDFSYDIRGRYSKGGEADTDRWDCSEGDLFKEAFDFFAQPNITTDGKGWDAIDKKELFCDSGWFNTLNTDWADEQTDCRDAIDLVEAYGYDYDDDDVRYLVFAGAPDYETHVQNLINYLNKNYFDDYNITDLSYTEDEKYYLFKSLITGYCSEGNRNKITDVTELKNVKSSSSKTIFTSLDYFVDSAELQYRMYSAPVNTKHFNTRWYDSSYTSSEDEDCNNKGQMNKRLESLDKSPVKAAKGTLIKELKEVCKKNYTDYYNDHKEYYNSLTDEQKKGDKKDYVEWYKKLPTGPPEDSVCFEVNEDKNPLFKCKMQEYIDQYSSTNPDPDSPSYAGFVLTDDDSDVNANGEETYDCYTRAASLGWILCPIIDNLSNYIQRTYEQHITNFLVLDAGLFENGSTRAAWTNFQTIANVFFVIIFLVVILSQLTGFGIDNYGIKKILPKLILCAIIINLSYIICQLAIEIANIVGYGIGWIFEHIGTQITELRISEAASVASSGGDVNGSAGFAIAIIIGLVIILTAGAVLAIGPSVLVPIFLGLIAIAIAILSCFVILALRKALSVVLVVISPLAFLCYMLPNTKSLFNRWFKAFQGVLIAFPVCSAMVYGGQAVARLVINGTNATTVPFMLALSAAVIAVIPIFFIPRVVSKSMGAISAGISNLANRARATGQNRFRNSNAAQDFTQMSQQMRNRRAAGVNLRGGDTLRKKAGDKISNRLSGHRGLSAIANARNNRLGRARSRYLSDLAENDKNARNLSQDSRKRQQFNDQVKNYMDSAAFEADTMNGNMDEMYKMVSGTHDINDKNIDWSTEEGKVRGRAMLKALAATKEGKKMLSSGVRSGEIAGDAYKQMAEDAGIRSAINEKDQYVAAALNSGQDWTTWYGNGDNANTRNVTKNLDKSDLYSQSGAAFQDALNQEEGKMITNERLQADMANPNIDMGDKVKNIKDMRGITASDPNAKLTEAMNNLAGEMKINRERGTLGGGYSNGPSLSGHNAQQQSKNNGGSGGGGIGNAGNIPD